MRKYGKYGNSIISSGLNGWKLAIHCNCEFVNL